MTRKMLLFEIFLIAAACATTVVAYPNLPGRVAMHWDFHLRPNWYGPKWALFLFGPGMMAVVSLFTYLGPWLSPKRFEVDSFPSTWRRIMLLIFCMSAYIYTAMLLAGLRHNVDAGRIVLGGVCLTVALMGNLLGKVRKNFYIGVRTPWTLADDRVWNATHRFAARTWMVAGLLGLLLTMLGFRALSISVLLTGALAPYAYSLAAYKQRERLGETGAWSDVSRR